MRQSASGSKEQDALNFLWRMSPARTAAGCRKTGIDARLRKGDFCGTRASRISRAGFSSGRPRPGAGPPRALPSPANGGGKREETWPKRRRRPIKHFVTTQSDPIGPPVRAILRPRICARVPPPRTPAPDQQTDASHALTRWRLPPPRPFELRPRSSIAPRERPEKR